jgi:hypothetical protein
VAHQWQQKTAAALEENDAKALQEMLAVMNRKPGEAGAAKATAYFVAKDHSKQFTSVSLFSIALVSPAGLLVNIFFFISLFSGPLVLRNYFSFGERKMARQQQHLCCQCLQSRPKNPRLQQNLRMKMQKRCGR